MSHIKMLILDCGPDRSYMFELGQRSTIKTEYVLVYDVVLLTATKGRVWILDFFSCAKIWCSAAWLKLFGCLNNSVELLTMQEALSLAGEFESRMR